MALLAAALLPILLTGYSAIDRAEIELPRKIIQAPHNSINTPHFFALAR